MTKMNIRNCLACYQELLSEVGDFHKDCSKRLFGSKEPPEFPFDLRDTMEGGRKIIVGRIALTGVQPKLSLEIQRLGDSNSRRFTIVGLEGEWSGYILKPPTTRYEELPQNEDLVMHLARIAKIHTAEHSLIRMHSGELAYITKRFDRHRTKGSHTKFKLEDMCQLTRRLTENKYKGSMEQVGKAIAEFSSNPGIEVIKFYDVARFCFLVGNADMHLKNFSLLSKEGVTSLSPAYDILSTELAVHDEDETALPINGKQRNLRSKDWQLFGESLKINPESLNASNEALRDALPTMFSFIERSFLNEERKQRLGDFVKMRAARLFD